MVKVQWADGWMKGQEATIALTYCFPLKMQIREFVLDASEFCYSCVQLA